MERVSRWRPGRLTAGSAMILELRALLSLVVVGVLALAMTLLNWQLVFPLVAVAYLGYKYFYYRRRIDPGKTGWDPDPKPGQLLEQTTLLFVGLFAVSRLAVFPALQPFWSESTLAVPTLNMTDVQVLIDQLLPLVGAWVAILLPLVIVSYAVGQFRVRLEAGIDSPQAAARAAIWETTARVPVYLLWAGLFVLSPVYDFWAGIPEGFADASGLPLLVGSGFAPVLGDLFFVVLAAGHVVPILVIGAYFAVNTDKYGDVTVPEVLGYRGFYAPDRRLATANLAVPAVAFLLYAAAVVTFLPAGDPARPAMALPPVVAILVGADVRGQTSRLKRALPRWVPGVGADAVVFGLTVGVATLALFVLGRAAGLGGLGVDPAAALFYPVIAAPLTLAANEGLAQLEARSVDSLQARVQADPSTLRESDVDRLLVYAEARSDRLRTAAIDGLAAAVWASPYREAAAVDVFESALASSRFARPGLQGIVSLLRADRGPQSVDPVLDAATFHTVEAHLSDPDPRTQALAAEAFGRMTATSYRRRRADRLFADVEELPLDAVERAVGGEAANQSLTDGAVEGFATLWYARDGFVADRLTAADEQTLLTDLVWWAEYASDVPRGKAAFALASGPAVADESSLADVQASLDSEVDDVRFMAAHVVRSSTAEHADQIEVDLLLSILDDPAELVRWAGADALQAYVRATGESEGVLSALLGHLEATDPAAAGPAEATIMSTLELVDETAVTEEEGVAETVAEYVGSDDGAVAESAAAVLATYVTANADEGVSESVRTALETGLTHENDAVRDHCLRAIAAVVEADPGAGRPYVRGLVLNLATSGDIGEIAASTLTQVLAEYPEYGTEYLPEMAGGLRNPTSISRQYAGAMVVGRTVSQVTADILADITEYDTTKGDLLIGPLVDLAGNTASPARESVFTALANLSADFPDEAQEALPAAQAALDAGDVRVRRNAAQVLSNVAIDHPDAVAPMASRLMVAVDDADPQMRSIALVTLGTIGAEEPEAIEADIRRIIGRLDDDSSLVREHAAKAIITVGQRQPDVVEPAAEASDRLRRIQRDPAVELDEELVNQAANAIRTGTPPGEAVESEASEGSTDIFTPESAAEAGQSGDTRVFEPPSDDDEEAAEEPDEEAYPTAEGPPTDEGAEGDDEST